MVGIVVIYDVMCGIITVILKLLLLLRNILIILLFTTNV